jgi:hypothetical protein
MLPSPTNDSRRMKKGLVAAADAAEIVLNPNIEVDSWLRIPFYDLDYGSGGWEGEEIGGAVFFSSLFRGQE